MKSKGEWWYRQRRPKKHVFSYCWIDPGKKKHYFKNLRFLKIFEEKKEKNVFKKKNIDSAVVRIIPQQNLDTFS